MNYTKEQKERYDNAKTLEEKKKVLSELGLELTDDEITAVTGGFFSHEGKHCGTTPDPLCTGVFFGLDACKYYVEEADPNGKATPYTYPVLCSCTRGYYKQVPMNRSYQS